MLRKGKFWFFAVLLIGFYEVKGQDFTAVYSFANVTSSSGKTDPTPVPVVSHVTFGSFISTATALNPNASGRFSFTGWPTGASKGSDAFTGSLSTTRYFEVTLTPEAGYGITLTNLTFQVQRSSTGIRQYAVRSSMDNFTANLPASISPANTDLTVVPTN